MKNASYDYKSVDDIKLMRANENAAYDYKSVDDNIQYLNKCGDNDHLVTF